MAEVSLTPDDPDFTPQRITAAASGELVSDDDRSVAADSWSIKSDYGSTLDDDQRHSDASDALAMGSNLCPSSDYRFSPSLNSDREDEDGDGIQSMLGLQSYWDAAYSNELVNFRDHGHDGEIWFGAEVMEIVASWTTSMCISISHKGVLDYINDLKREAAEPVQVDDQNVLSSWSVLDLGTGNGLLLHQLAKNGFSELSGSDYSEGAINLAQGIAERDGLTSINFLVDDILETKLERKFSLVMDKGTLDAIGLHPDGPSKRLMYWDSVSKLVFPGGLLVITSCNSTKDELVQEVEKYNNRREATTIECASESKTQQACDQDTTTPIFRYIDHVKTYPTFMFGGVVGSRVATVAFLRS